MDGVAQFIESQGWMGVWLITVGWFVYLFSSGKLISLREHQARIADKENETRARVEDLKERLRDEQRSSELWREAALASAEMGQIITKAKVSISGRRQDDE